MITAFLLERGIIGKRRTAVLYVTSNRLGCRHDGSQGHWRNHGPHVRLGLHRLGVDTRIAGVKPAVQGKNWSLKELEAENAKLKRIVADQALDNAALKNLLSRKW
jgi:hypothetical protein